MNKLLQYLTRTIVVVASLAISSLPGAQVNIADIQMTSFISFDSSRARAYFASPVAIRGGGIAPDGSTIFYFDGQVIDDDMVTPYVKDGIAGVRFRGDFYAMTSDLPPQS